MEPMSLARNLIPSAKPKIGYEFTQKPFIQVQLMGHLIFGGGISSDEATYTGVTK